MMKLSKQAARHIQDAIAQLDDGIAYIQSDYTRIIRLSSVAAMPEDSWSTKSGSHGVAVNKDIGSKLCQIYNARDALKRMITPAVKEIA